MNKEYLFTIIMPIYNAEEYLEYSIKSVLSQTFDNFELLLIDDGSTDSSLKIAKKYQGDNIRIISRDNKGILYTRIEGIKEAKGKYIMFVDSDDLISNNVLEVFSKYVKDKDYDIIRGNYELFGRNFKKEKIEFPYLKEINRGDYKEKVYDKFLTSPIYNSIWRTAIKKDIFDTSIPLNISMGDDQALILRAINKSKKILLIPEIVYSYRINENSITNVRMISKKCKNYDDIYNLYFEIIIPFFKEIGDMDLIKKAYVRYLRDCNMNFFDIFKICENKDVIEEYHNKLFDSDLTKEARNIISFSNIKKQKTGIFLNAILKNKKKQHLFLIRILSIIKK